MNAACQASLSITNSQSSLRLTSIESVMPSSHLILCRPLLLLPPIPPYIWNLERCVELLVLVSWNICSWKLAIMLRERPSIPVEGPNHTLSWQTSKTRKQCDQATLKLAQIGLPWETVSSLYKFNSVQSLRCVWLFVTPWTAASQASVSITNARSLLKFISIKSVMPFIHLILYCPLPLLPSTFPSSGSLSMSQFYASGSQISEFQLQHKFFQWIFRTYFL